MIDHVMEDSHTQKWFVVTERPEEDEQKCLQYNKYENAISLLDWREKEESGKNDGEVKIQFQNEKVGGEGEVQDLRNPPNGFCKESTKN